MLIAEWQVGEVVWAMFWFTVFFLWIWLVIAIFVDVFRSDDLGGGAKALWCLFLIVVPYLAVFVYLIARGGTMRERAEADARTRDREQREYIREAAGTASSPAAEVERLANLRAQGAIDEAEFQNLKGQGSRLTRGEMIPPEAGGRPRLGGHRPRPPTPRRIIPFA